MESSPKLGNCARRTQFPPIPERRVPAKFFAKLDNFHQKDADSAETSTVSPTKVFRRMGKFPPNGRSLCVNQHSESHQMDKLEDSPKLKNFHQVAAVSDKSSTASPTKVFLPLERFSPNGRSFRRGEYGESHRSFSSNAKVFAKWTQFPLTRVR